MRVKKNILITGAPGVGKTTIVRRIADELKDLNPVGFYTAEIREEGTRKGFELKGFDGTTFILSHTKIKGSHRVGKYVVDIKAFDEFLDKLRPVKFSARVVIIDEVGKMECFSSKFREIISELLDSSIPVVATVALRGGGLISEIKDRSDVDIFEVTHGNRNTLPPYLMSLVREAIED